MYTCIYINQAVFFIFFLAINQQVPSKYMTATAEGTYEDSNMAPFEARPSSPTPWCAYYDKIGEWLAIDLRTSQPVNKIELVKLNSDTKFVTSYTVEHSNDGQSWHSYHYGQVILALPLQLALRRKWSHFRILSTDSKVRITFYSIINSTTGKYCPVAFI